MVGIENTLEFTAALDAVQGMGAKELPTGIPYMIYNPSLLLLRRNEVVDVLCHQEVMNRLCEAGFQGDVLVITWFGKQPGHCYGCHNWIGILYIDELLRHMTKPHHMAMWLLKPAFLGGFEGPKLADLRLTKVLCMGRFDWGQSGSQGWGGSHYQNILATISHVLY